MECLEFSWIQFYKTLLVVAFCLSLVQNQYKEMEKNICSSLRSMKNYVTVMTVFAQVENEMENLNITKQGMIRKTVSRVS